jgi:hypothetical protein
MLQKILLSAMLVAISLGMAGAEQKRETPEEEYQAFERGLKRLQIEPLEGLSGVRVLVSEIDSAVAPTGLTKVGIQAAVEGRLRSRGVRVLDRREWTSELGRPSLTVAVHLMPASRYLQGPSFRKGTIRTQMKEDARLARNGRRVRAVTWNRSMLLHFPPDTARDVERAALRDADAFADAYLAANPRQPAESKKEE